MGGSYFVVVPARLEPMLSMQWPSLCWMDLAVLRLRVVVVVVVVGRVVGCVVAEGLVAVVVVGLALVDG